MTPMNLADAAPESSPSAGEAIVRLAYDASDVTLRVLRTFGWGPMLNLGYYPIGPPLTLLNFIATPHLLAPFFRLPAAQLRLIKKAIALLPLHDGNRVLDVGCGRGISSFIMANSFPRLEVVGVDLLADHVLVARTLYGNTPNLRFTSGDAMQLDFPDRSFDRALCVEAAFQFPDRGQFLRELSRVVAPGGRLVVVDFMWETNAARRLCDADALRAVQTTWQWTDLDSVGEYHEQIQRSGFRIVECLDWTSHVTAPIITIFDVVARLARGPRGRAFLQWFNPMMRSIGDDDWRAFVRSADAHRELHRFARYVALVLTH